jgi:hypothetical protein
MSWIEKIKTDLTITTGDGKTYTPSWINAKKQIDYQTTEFTFIGVKGSLVSRGEQIGQKIALQVYFQGEDHLDVASAFELSASDNRFWVLSHPLYGLLNVQPISLAVDNSNYNVSKITIPIVETIIETTPKTPLIVADKVEEDAELLTELTSERFGLSVEPDANDKRVMAQVVDSLKKNTEVEIIDDAAGQTFSNKYNTAKADILDATENPSISMASIQSVVMEPALLQQDIASRLIISKRNLISYKTTITNGFDTLLGLPNSYKSLYEVIGSSIISALLLTAATPLNESDYPTRSSVTDTTSLILSTVNQYLEDLDAMQSGSGGDIIDFVPSSDGIISLMNLVNFTTASLLQIALGAKQERFYTTEDDTDLISLTHQLYGLKKDDSTIDEMIRLNNIGLKQMLNIEKGTVINYYV